MTDLRYPIGPFFVHGPALRSRAPGRGGCHRRTPQALRAAVKGLGDVELETPYRPEGWTVRQVVHHVPDSHMNAYIRTKLALTEDEPTIKPYDEAQWANLIDATSAPVETSLELLECVHERWVMVLRAMKPEQWSRTLLHPEHGKTPFTLDWLAALYAWHGRAPHGARDLDCGNG